MASSRVIHTIAFLCLSAPALAAPPDPAPILDGVKSIAAPGIPGPLCVFGDQAFPVAVGRTGKQSEPVVAAAQFGTGRVVAFGHTGYFDAEALAAADTGRLVTNAVHWAARSPSDKAAVTVAVRGCPGLLKFLQDQGFKAEALDGSDWSERLKSFDVICCRPSSLSNDDISAVSAYVRAGHGLLLADLGWGWLQLHPGKTVHDHPGNRLLAPVGIVWADGYLERSSDAGYALDGPPPQLCHAAHALDALVAQSTGKTKLSADDTAQAVCAATRAARSLPLDDKLLRPRLRELQNQHRDADYPTAKKPLTMTQPLARLLLTLDLEEARTLAPEKVKPHPAAATFPGAVPDNAPRVTRTLDIDAAVPAWHSTGLYAPPGQVVLIDTPDPAVSKNLRVRIGVHSDTLWDNDSWSRCPEICREFPLNQARTSAANAFGGLIYIDVPEHCPLGTLAITIRNAIEAPHYIHGKTQLAEWREKIRQFPAPWAELESKKIVLTVPSSAVRKLDDPAALMDLWDKISDAEADLATIPRERPRAERYVTDQQISAGYMHSGYPIMTFLDVADVFVDRPRIMANGHAGVWGFFHELGHNHQSGDWTFDGTGEVTCNLFTLYVFDTVCGRPAETHDSFTAKARAEKLKAYLAAGAKFETWKSDPFLALTMYVQLQQAFGWDAFKKVFAEYRDLPRNQRPKTDDEKRDQWLVRFSHAAGRNLGPFFEAWGVPTSAAARESIANLPKWMPDDWPSK